MPTDHDYPDGFTTAPNVTGALYISPKDGGPSIAGNGQLTLGGGNLESNLVKSVVIAANGTVTVSPIGSDKLTLKINPTTGQFSGSFLNPSCWQGLEAQRFFLADQQFGGGILPGNKSNRLRHPGTRSVRRYLAGIHQRFADTPLEFFAAGDNIDVESIKSFALDFDPGVLVVVGTPHLGNNGLIIPFDLFDRRIESRTQSKTSHLMNV